MSSELPLAWEPDEADRFPVLNDAARRIMRWLIEHPFAPMFRNQSGHRLNAQDLHDFSAFEARMHDQAIWQSYNPEFDRAPSWLVEFVRHTFAQTPHYRDLGTMPRKFSDIAPVSRADFAAEVVRFVPDDICSARVIHYSTSGTTGHKLMLPSHPRVASRYRVFYERALARFGVRLNAGTNEVGALLVGYQQRCFTYVSVVPMRGDCGLVKINLHLDDWREAEDRARFLDAIKAELYSGDPISFQELLSLNSAHRPKALVSTSMCLTAALRARLAEHFECPVLDLYSMNEAGPIAVFDPQYNAHVLLQPELIVEVLRPDGTRADAGERGEVTLTGGFNFCLPLLRYRTGDYAALLQRAGEWMLTELSGRPPVRFRTMSGVWINNVDVTHVLKPFPLAQWNLTQHADAALTLAIAPCSQTLANDVTQALLGKFGATQALQVLALDPHADKQVQYRQFLAEAEG